MSPSPSPDAEPDAYVLHVLTDQWQWEDAISAASVEQARASARDALMTVVREEKPDLACITLARGEVKLGVWDWVNGQPHWSWF